MTRARRGATGLSGILPIDKPAGMTSHDVVARLRKATGERRIGHAGTLDPMATGLLVMLVGPMTRLERYLSASFKTYLATITFGTATDTDDAEGETISTAEVPDELFHERRAQEILDTFLGESMQMPPAYSAIKVGGRVSHRVARAGGELELTPRRVDVTMAELEGFDAEARTWDVCFHVSKGTYVRSLARDVGLAAGTVAHLSALRRIEAGALDVGRDAYQLEDAEAAAHEGRISDLFADPLCVLGMPFIDLDEEAAAAVAVGRSLPSPESLADHAHVALAVDGNLRAIYVREGVLLKPEVVLGGGA